MPQNPSSGTSAGPLKVPGYFSVKAAARWLGIGERSVLELIERRRLLSSRLGRMHFIPTRLLHAYQAERKLRRRKGRAGGNRAA